MRIFLVALIALGGIGASQQARSANNGAVAFVQEAYQHFAHLHASKSASTEASIALIAPLFDFDAFYALTVQDFAPSLSAEDKAKLKQLFSQAFFTQLARKGLRMGPSGLKQVSYRVQVLDHERALVALNGVAEGQSGEQATITLGFYLRASAPGWRIEDLSIDGVNLSRNYRGSFNRLYREEGVDGIMARMEHHLAKNESPDRPRPNPVVY